MRKLLGYPIRACGCFVLLLVLFAAAVAGAVWLFTERAHAADPPQAPASAPATAYDIVLIVDQSVSMWECNGVGSDPQMLRVRAAHLFIGYLGADSSNARYRLGVVNFGGSAVQVAPLTDVSTEAMRQQLLDVTANPEPIPWTNPLDALTLANKLLLDGADTADPAVRRVVVMLTDGQPAWPADHAINYKSYQADLRAAAGQLTSQGADIFFVHLNNPGSTCDQTAMLADWLPFWRELVSQTPRGGLYEAKAASDLLPIYHSIVSDLTGVTESSALTDTDLATGQVLSVEVPVDRELASMTLVILKEMADTAVALIDPTGAAFVADSPTLRVTGARTQQEIWRIERPAIGAWRVVLNGKGTVTVWQDRVPLPAPPTPTVTATPTPSQTPTPSPTPTATATATPTDTPKPTATATATPSPTPTDTPSPTATNTATATASATALPPVPVQRTNGGWNWLWVLVGASVVVGVSGALMTRSRRNGHWLSGQLIPLAAPPDQLTPLTYDLGMLRAHAFALGRKAKGEWQLAGWEGAAKIVADARGIAIVPLAGEVRVNDVPLAQRMALHDGDVLTFGDYRIRYENLLI